MTPKYNPIIMAAQMPYERTAEEKAARKEFFRAHGKEINAKKRAFEQLIRTPPVQVSPELGLLPHPVLVSRVAESKQLNWFGYMPGYSVYYSEDREHTYIRIDAIIFPTLAPDHQMKVVRAGNDWYVNRLMMHDVITKHSIVPNQDKKKWPSLIEVQAVDFQFNLDGSLK